MRSCGEIQLQRYRMRENVNIQQLDLVMLDSDGFVLPAQELEQNRGVVGIAIATQTSSPDVDFVVVQKGAFLLDGIDLTQSMVGDFVYASNAQSIKKKSNENEARVGIVLNVVNSKKAWVLIGRI